MNIFFSEPFLYVFGGFSLAACCYAVMRVRRFNKKDSLAFGLGVFGITMVLTIAKFLIF